MAESLLQQGARIDAPQHDNSPLYEAASRGHMTLVKLLLAHGALVVGPGTQRSALKAAADAGHVEITRLLATELLDKEKDPTTLATILRQGTSSKVQELHDFFAVIDKVSCTAVPNGGVVRRGQLANS